MKQRETTRSILAKRFKRTSHSAALIFRSSACAKVRFSLLLLIAGASAGCTAQTVTSLPQDVRTATYTNPATYTFVSFEPPHGMVTLAGCTFGIDNAGDVVGCYYDSHGAHGFERLANGTLSTFTDPNASATVGAGINYLGTTIVGTACIKKTKRSSAVRGGCGGSYEWGGYLLQSGSFTNYLFQGDSTFIYAINDNGLFVGKYSGGGFISNGTTVAGAVLAGINNRGIVVGYAGSSAYEYDTTGKNLGKIAVPGIVPASGLGINNKRFVVGLFLDSQKKSHCFIYRKGMYAQLDVPNAASITSCDGINDGGQIVGTYQAQNGGPTGFIATP